MATNKNLDGATVVVVEVVRHEIAACVPFGGKSSYCIIVSP
jgi:hypothetical protein